MTVPVIEAAGDRRKHRFIVIEYLRQGDILYRERFGCETSPERILWALICDAVETIESMPDTERRHLTRSARSNMPDVMRRLIDVYMIELMRIQDGMSPWDERPVRIPPKVGSLDRALEVLAWFRYFERSKAPERMRRAIWALANGRPGHVVARLWRPGVREITPQDVNDMKRRALGMILDGIERDYGVKAHGAGFALV